MTHANDEGAILFALTGLRGLRRMMGHMPNRPVLCRPECALCLPLQAETARDWQGVAPWLGVSMQGLDLDRSESEFGEWTTSILGATSAIHVSFLTSSDLPAASGFKSLAKNLSTIRSHLVSAA